jgi:hypothetical protein
MIRSDLTYALSTGKPLLIDPIKAKSFLANANSILSNPDLAYLLSQHVAGKSYEAKQDAGPKGKRFAPKADDDDFGDTGIAVSTKPYVRDGIGIIPVRGVIGKTLSALEAMLGCADIDTIAKTLDEWKDNDNIFEVILAIDSGGGSTTGLEELAKKIRNYEKPTIGFSESDMGSAAFWIGSQCKRLVVTPSSSVGACGVYITMNDDRKKYEKEGREVVVIKSGKYKAAGVEGTSLTDDQMKSLQEEVDELHNRFIRDVTSVRQFAKLDDLQGQSFYGDKAVARGLCTGLVDSFEDLITDIKNTRRVAHRTTLPGLYNPIYPSSMDGIQPYQG